MAVGSAVAASQACAPPPEVDERPNVVLYLIDTLRADRVGLYGYDRPTSPVMDSLGSGGAVFERAYAADTRTLGSVPSLLASLETPSHGMREYGDKLPEDVVTLAGIFRAEGYDTASFVTNMVAGPMTGLDRGFAHFHDAIKSFANRKARRTFPGSAFTGWLDRIHAGRDAPFFAYVHTAEPHMPYIPPPRLLRLFEEGYEGKVTGYYGGEHGFRHATSPEDMAHVNALYDAEVRLADEALGKMLARLEERGLLENTFVIVTSDHGEELRDHGGWRHGHSAYDELLRVPLIMSGPGLPAGRRLKELVTLLDVAPTILELTGTPIPEAFQGTGQLDLITGRRPEVLEGKAIFTRTTEAPARAVMIQDRWKCIFTEGGAVELYDLEDDPGETRDLAEVEEERATALFARLRGWMEGSATGRQAPRMELTEEDIEGLRALGYVE